MKKKSNTLKLKMTACAALAAIVFCTLASAAETEKLKMVFSPDLDFLMDCSIAIEKGYFKEAGLDLEYVTVRGGSAAIMSTLLRKEINGVFIASPTALTAIKKGVDLVMFCGIGNRQFQWTVLSDSPIKSLQDLGGLKIANSPKPAGPWLALKYDLDHMGINAELIEMNGGGDRISALLTGQVQAALHSPQFQARYGQKLRLVHTSTISKYLWNSCGWWLKREYLADHPEAARRFVTSLGKARQLINSNPDEAVDIFSKYGRIRNNKFVEPFQLANFDDPPAVYQYGLQKVIDIMNEYGLLNESMRAEDYVDGRFARLIDHDYK